MARNQEKAQSMLFRFRQAQAENLGLVGHVERRPTEPSEVTKLTDAEKWRQQIIREISRKVAQILDVGLTDFQIRDLNDDINKSFREKRRWEDQIKHLGGPDYKRAGSKMLDNEGKEVPGSSGYRYFGRARDLPGVRELFSTQVVTPDQKTRFEMYRNVDADYYGYRDEEDGDLLEFEQSIENQMRANGETLFTNEEDLEIEIKRTGRRKRNRSRSQKVVAKDDSPDSP